MTKKCAGCRKAVRKGQPYVVLSYATPVEDGWVVDELRRWHELCVPPEIEYRKPRRRR